MPPTTKACNSRGYFGVAVYHPKTEVNIGSLWRTAKLYGASFLATIGERYKPQASDTIKSTRHMPLFRFNEFDELLHLAPAGCPVVGVELCDRAVMLADFYHPPRGIYLLGAEDHGIPASVLDRCHAVVKMPGERSLNLAVAGSIVIYDRLASGRMGWKGIRGGGSEED